MPEPSYRLRLETAVPDALATADAATIESEPRQQTKHESTEPEQADVSADDSIDKQLDAELSSSDEQNLLKT